MKARLIILAAALAACNGEERAPEEQLEVARADPRLDRTRAGKPAPEAMFEDPAGEPANLADFRGKPLLVNLWATWCAPCIAEMPLLDQLAASRDDIKVLALSQDLAGPEKVEAFFAERDFKMLEPYIDPELAIMDALGIDTLPTTILYDAEGREVWRMTGMADWTGDRAAKLIAEAEG
ncbi:MAG: TlpA family protein disulfide reductase [Sphingomonadaceae bacterium]